MLTEPMQVLMSQYKNQTANYTPREVLKQAIFLETSNRQSAAAAKQQMMNAAVASKLNLEV